MILNQSKALTVLLKEQIILFTTESRPLIKFLPSSDCKYMVMQLIYCYLYLHGKYFIVLSYSLKEASLQRL